MSYSENYWSAFTPFTEDEMWGCEITDSDTGIVGSTNRWRSSKSKAYDDAWNDLQSKLSNYAPSYNEGSSNYSDSQSSKSSENINYGDTIGGSYDGGYSGGGSYNGGGSYTTDSNDWEEIIGKGFALILILGVISCIFSVFKECNSPKRNYKSYQSESNNQSNESNVDNRMHNPLGSSNNNIKPTIVEEYSAPEKPLIAPDPEKNNIDKAPDYESQSAEYNDPQSTNVEPGSYNSGGYNTTTGNNYYHSNEGNTTTGNNNYQNPETPQQQNSKVIVRGSDGYFYYAIRGIDGRVYYEKTSDKLKY